MIRTLSENLGMFLYPQVAMSLLTVSLVAGYFTAWKRGELNPGEKPWKEQLDPLAGMALSLGLLGSVVGICLSVGSLGGNLDVTRLMSGLAKAYWTTGAGLIIALTAAAGSYALGVLNRRKGVRNGQPKRSPRTA